MQVDAFSACRPVGQRRHRARAAGSSRVHRPAPALRPRPAGHGDRRRVRPQRPGRTRASRGCPRCPRSCRSSVARGQPHDRRSVRCPCAPAAAGEVVIGLVDRPAQQTQEPLVVDYAQERPPARLRLVRLRQDRDAADHRACSASAGRRRTARPYVYALDCGGGGLSVLGPLSSVGAVVPETDPRPVPAADPDGPPHGHRAQRDARGRTAPPTCPGWPPPECRCPASTCSSTTCRRCRRRRARRRRPTRPRRPAPPGAAGRAPLSGCTSPPPRRQRVGLPAAMMAASRSAWSCG